MTGHYLLAIDNNCNTWTTNYALQTLNVITGHYFHAIDIKRNTWTKHYTLQTAGVTLVGPQTRHAWRPTSASSLLSRLQFAKGITFVLRTSSPICE